MKPIPLLLLTLVFFIGPVACSKGGNSSSGVSSKKVASFTARCGLVIPPTANATDYRSVFSMDGSKTLRMEMPVSELPGFLSKSGLDQELTNTSREKPATSYLGNFLQAHPKTFREGQKSLPGQEYLNVLVDEDSPTVAVVYLHWFGT